MKTVVILAYNPGNAGMYSVDMAARSMFGKQSDVAFFVAHKNKQGGPYLYGLSLRVLTIDVLRQAQRIIYWGDFLNNPLYGRASFSRRDVNFGYSDNASTAFRRWRQFFLLDTPDLQWSQATILSFGGNFMNLASTFDPDLSENRYRELLGRFHEIYPRDPSSLAELESLAPSGMLAKAGMDCAFLLAQPRRRRRPNNYFIYFFERSQISESDVIAAQVARETGLVPLSIPRWFSLELVNIDGFPFLLRGHLFSRMLKIIEGAAFVITDVYHLSVNAIRSGTRTICVGRKGIQESTVSDFKKKVLFQSLGIDEDYLEIDSETSAAQIAAWIAVRLKAAGYFADNLPRIDSMVQSFREEVEEAIHEKATK